MWYNVAEPNSYLVITGAGVRTAKIEKKALVLPFQRVTKISITPFSFSMSFQAMTIEKVHEQEIVKGVIEGETRSIVSTMTMEELFKEREIFKSKVRDNVQVELDHSNANVKELQYTPGTEYFASLSRKAHEGALNQVKVDVALARMTGESEIAKINVNTAALETERKSEKVAADSRPKTKEIQIEKELQTKLAGGKKYNEQADSEAKFYQGQQAAEADFCRQSRAADADLPAKKQATDADFYHETRAAEANFQAKKLEADALCLTQERKSAAAYIATKNEAAGIKGMAQAYAAMADVLGGPQGLIQYPMLRNNTYESLANANANANTKAINGLQPTINIWNTSAQGEDADPTAPIRDLFQSLPPLLATIQEQTGTSPPSWLAQTPAQEESGFPDSKAAQKRGLTNGINGHTKVASP
ncbi:hypothetical protein B0A49_10740 [Cryomyces minteri]|uniref:Band 7 domain-containing protein n=1 Tax=Cryomyces minteri TaxID=331657 RepID=A0A4U0VS67_9PEZI|nr:hypothetical protein B0A49_10740 [Cryomyces minteri]